MIQTVIVQKSSKGQVQILVNQQGDPVVTVTNQVFFDLKIFYTSEAGSENPHNEKHHHYRS